MKLKMLARRAKVNNSFLKEIDMIIFFLSNSIKSTRKKTINTAD